MTLTKAVKIVTQATQPTGLGVSPDFLEALKLLIEAGKRIQAYRSWGSEPSGELLPGETEA